MSTEAQRRASAKYSRNNRDKFKTYSLKLNKEEDKDIIEAFETRGVQAYIKELVRTDLRCVKNV